MPIIISHPEEIYYENAERNNAEGKNVEKKISKNKHRRKKYRKKNAEVTLVEEKNVDRIKRRKL
jgi:hypothetical protein